MSRTWVAAFRHSRLVVSVFMSCSIDCSSREQRWERESATANLPSTFFSSFLQESQTSIWIYFETLVRYKIFMEVRSSFGSKEWAFHLRRGTLTWYYYTWHVSRNSLLQRSRTTPTPSHLRASDPDDWLSLRINEMSPGTRPGKRYSERLSQITKIVGEVSTELAKKVCTM